MVRLVQSNGTEKQMTKSIRIWKEANGGAFATTKMKVRFPEPLD
jgi:hypothetical protein